MHSPSKSAPLGPSELTAEDAERFAALFKPIWELDDAPFAAAKTQALANDVHLVQGAGVHADVQLVTNGTATAIGPHAPPASYKPPPAADDGSVVLEIEPDPTPPPQPQMMQMAPQPAMVAHAQPQPRPPQQPEPPPRRSSRPPSSRRRPPAQVARSHGADISGDFVPPKKSNVGLFIGIGLAAVLVAGGIAYKVMSSNAKDEGDVKPTTTTTAQKHEEPRIPPPPPIDETPKVAATDTAHPKIDPPKIDPPKMDPPKVDPPKVDPPTVRTTTKPIDTPKPPPVTTTKPATGGGTKPASTKPGGGIVRDNPF